MTSNAYRMSSRGQRRGAGEGPGQRPVLAVRHAAADGRGDPRLDPRRHRQAEPEDVRPGRLSRDPAGSAGRPVDARQRLGQVAARGAGPPQRLHPREAVAAARRSSRASTSPRPTAPAPVRFATTQPTQALAMLNGDFLNEQAGVFAARLRARGRRRRRRSRSAWPCAWPPAAQPDATTEIRRGIDLIARLASQRQASTPTRR